MSGRSAPGQSPEEAAAGAGNGAEESSGEKFSAIYTYVAQYEDELSFEEGDVITVLSKDEADWWKGELNGKSGVFPSNYVEPFKCKSTSLSPLNSTKCFLMTLSRSSCPSVCFVVSSSNVF